MKADIHPAAGSTSCFLTFRNAYRKFSEIRIWSRYYFLFFKSALAIRTVLSICDCSSLDFPSFRSSRIKEISSGEKRIPFLFALVIRARRTGARSFPDFPFVFAAAVWISSSFTGSIFCNIGCSIQLFMYNSLQKIIFM